MEYNPKPVFLFPSPQQLVKFIDGDERFTFPEATRATRQFMV